jgi:hypothetical protein
MHLTFRQQSVSAERATCKCNPERAPVHSPWLCRFPAAIDRPVSIPLLGLRQAILSVQPAVRADR